MMGISADSVPARLYHYTNIDTLALILGNKSIRLMPLCGLDDPQENQTKDLYNFGRFFFVSCWTDDVRESIPMWRMYTNLDAGVRISLPANPFRSYTYTKEEVSSIFNIPVDRIDGDETITTFLPLEDAVSGMCSIAIFGGDKVLKKIEYTDDVSKLMPEIVKKHNENTELDWSTFGVCKNTGWEFQHEWRYLLNLTPLNLFGDLSSLEERASQMVQGMIDGTASAPCECYDLRISDEAFAQIEITPSPKMSMGNQMLLKYLLDAHGLSDRMRQSQLAGLL
ncbi:DUF2971 domain-containing protein [Collinsella ihumii]|uniref:DUF2971 domain-containing protein n=1 Tax=Collinsella ihumii TaxID=1720204 RepID=A0AAW7JR31_9ACTN|nr:DUF2971 domain-containing protein [Collinsella ihumii]MDN0069552.1 DUF2971 domain-containing protein [Collinsella ihumii]